MRHNYVFNPTAEITYSFSVVLQAAA